MTTARYALQTTACATVVCGVKLIVPFSSVAYQLRGGTCAEMSNASGRQPAEDAALLQVVDAVGEHAGGDDDRARRRST